MITQKELKELLHYAPDTGLFTRRITRHNHAAGSVVGFDHQGYRRTRIDKKNYMLHRLAFLYMEGDLPPAVDHINRVRDDNRWCNLRRSNWQHNATNKGMHSNNRSGLPGVHWCASKQRWIVQKMVNGKRINHTHRTLLDAAAERIR